MKYDIKSSAIKKVAYPVAIANIQMLERCLFRDELPLTLLQIIDNRYLMTSSQQGFHEMRANEASSSRY